MSLRPKHAIFVAEILKGKSATAAAITAGYSARATKQAAWQLLRNPAVRAAIHDGRNAIAQRALVSAEQVIRETAIVAFADLADVMDFTGDEICEKRAKTIDPQKRRAIQSVKITTKTTSYGRGDDKLTETTRTVEYRLWDKMAALDKLAKHFGLFLDQDQIQAIVAKQAEISARIAAK